MSSWPKFLTTRWCQDRGDSPSRQAEESGENRLMSNWNNGLHPGNAVFVAICFEGPDSYAQAGGLGIRITHLTQALARASYETHLVFIGDPNEPGQESSCEGRLTLHRWCQWISRYYPAGVYEGEEEKLYDFSETVPWFVTEEVIKPAILDGKLVVVLGEEWHTAETMCQLSDLLHAQDLRSRVVSFWNANNTTGFSRINWGRLAFTTTITTVSRYMKHIMQQMGLNPLVIPNGIPEQMLEPADPEAVGRLRQALGGELVLFKVARWDPAKRWLTAIDAAARLKGMGLQVVFAVRGGIEAHGGEVLHRAQEAGLRIARLDGGPVKDWRDCVDRIEGAGPADLLDLRFPLPQALLPIFYDAADVVLANSRHEPFGLVGLEAMAAGGVVFAGCSGEDYALPMKNAMVAETDDPEELVAGILYLRAQPETMVVLRQEARRTAQQFTWEQVIASPINKASYLACKQGVLRAPWTAPILTNASSVRDSLHTAEALLPTPVPRSLTQGTAVAVRRMLG
jgi:glycosyltransferase involved in cell wall biosynthesis